MISRRKFLSASSLATASLGLNLAASAKGVSLQSPRTAEPRDPAGRQDAKRIELQNGLVKVVYDRHTGKMDINWSDGHKLLGIASGAELSDGRVVSSSEYSEHYLEWSREAEESFKDGFKFTIRSVKAGMPVLRQHIWMQDGKPWISVQSELSSQAGIIGTRHFDVVAIRQDDAVQIDKGAQLRMLRVPFDNDMWVRYDSIPVKSMGDGSHCNSCEVTAFYDNASRHAIVIGAITHDLWKTSIDVQGNASGLTSIDIYGGISGPLGVRTNTHDTVPHGIVRGPRILSPRVFIGSFGDWREGMDTYGRANAEIQPLLVWPEGAPMGWNSWAAYANEINYQRYLGSIAYMRDVLVPEGFGREHVVYGNLDAFWSNLDAVQLADAVDIIKGMHDDHGMTFKPGIYWTPFAYWSDDLDVYVEGTDLKYRYRDILLRAPDGSFMPKVDGGRPIDPSSSGSKERVTHYISAFKEMGFTYLKLDFLSHGALEGAHQDPSIQTGIQAYNSGMQQITEENNGQMFLSLSIAPIFPSGYGHSRRISCDTKGHIDGKDQSTEYMLNSLTYGWWTSGNLYIADPDCIDLGVKADQGSRNVIEGRSRLLSTIISGGMILDSTRLADDPQGRAFAKEVYGNRNLFAVASEQKVFYPLEGNTGESACSAFVRRSKRGFYLAVFNYSFKDPQTVTFALKRIDRSLVHASRVVVKDVAASEMSTTMVDTISFYLAPAESKLVELVPEM